MGELRTSIRSPRDHVVVLDFFDQSLGTQTGKGGAGKAELKLKKRKEKRRKTKSKKVKSGKKEQNSKRGKGGKGKHGKIKGEGTRSKKRKGNKKKDKKKKDRKKKKTKENDKKKLGKGKEEKEEPEIEYSKKKESIEKESSRQVATAEADPDRYKHCDYLDLVEVGYREDSTCKPGDKMVFKGGKGIRRQFLMTPQTNVVVFLELGKKVTSCNNVFNDITSKVRCKPVNGVKAITSMTKKNSGSTCTRCPSRQENCPAKPTMGSDAEITCRCPAQRFFACIYKV